MHRIRAVGVHERDIIGSVCENREPFCSSYSNDFLMVGRQTHKLQLHFRGFYRIDRRRLLSDELQGLRKHSFY